MNTFFAGLLFGFLIYWAILALLIPQINFDTENQMVVAFVLSGPILWSVIGVIVIVRFVQESIRKSKYKALIIDIKTDEIYYTDSNWDEKEDSYPYYISWLYETEKGQQVMNEITEKYSEYWNKKFLGFGKINIRYCPKIVWKQYKKYKLSKSGKKKDE